MTDTTMKALAAMGYGRPEELVMIERAIPSAGRGQIQVRIKAATVNPTDLRVITGGYKAMGPVSFPYVLGNDFAGTVTQVGEDVSGYEVGDEVFGQALPRDLRAATSPTKPSVSTGSLAEYAVFEADTPLLAHRPDTVPVETAAALAISGMTARALMKIAQMRAGTSALIIGATGGSGTSLVSLLASQGIRVTATAGSPEKAEMLLRLGADATVGHDPADYPKDMDAVFNMALFQDRICHAAASLRTGGKLLSIMYPPATAADLGRDDVEYHFMLDMDGVYGGMPDVAEAASKGELTVEIGKVFLFDQAVDAVVAYAREKLPGKVVVKF
ncbi:Beta-ketoacyl-acyl-carrier-protein synthase I [Marinibacterium anthonyi]|nr:Beta-ketoacyl-acyl-carrier-protein synthase I [Marinibacterium anthonyi]